MGGGDGHLSRVSDIVYHMGLNSPEPWAVGPRIDSWSGQSNVNFSKRKEMTEREEKKKKALFSTTGDRYEQVKEWSLKLNS